MFDKLIAIQEEDHMYVQQCIDSTAESVKATSILLTLMLLPLINCNSPARLLSTNDFMNLSGG